MARAIIPNPIPPAHTHPYLVHSRPVSINFAPSQPLCLQNSRVELRCRTEVLGTKPAPWTHSLPEIYTHFINRCITEDVATTAIRKVVTTEELITCTSLHGPTPWLQGLARLWACDLVPASEVAGLQSKAWGGPPRPGAFPSRLQKWPRRGQCQPHRGPRKPGAR